MLRSDFHGFKITHTPAYVEKKLVGVEHYSLLAFCRFYYGRLSTAIGQKGPVQANDQDA